MKKKAKRVLSVIMLIFSILSLSSCYTDFYYDSLDEYIKQIKTNENGFSSFEIDPNIFYQPNHLLLIFNILMVNTYFMKKIFLDSKKAIRRFPF